MDYFAYGHRVPNETINALLSDGFTVEELTTERLEIIFYYDYMDNQ